MGIEGAACLANHLHALIRSNPRPDAASLVQLFEKYQRQRMTVINTWYKLGWAQMNFLTLETEQHRKTLERRIAAYGLPHGKEPLISESYLRNISRGIKLDYVPLRAELSGKIPWADGIFAMEPDLRPKL
jgi:REP element-mobilizing transposase RayT